MTKMDALGEKLLQLLGKDAKQSSEVLAKKLQVSPATVRRRVRQLLKDKVLHSIGVVDPNQVGLPLAALIAIDTAHESLEAVLKAIAARPEVKWVSTTTGRFDIMCMGRFRSTDDLAEFMQNTLGNMEGVRDSETFICLRIAKGHYVPAAFDFK